MAWDTTVTLTSHLPAKPAYVSKTGPESALSTRMQKESLHLPAVNKDCVWDPPIKIIVMILNNKPIQHFLHRCLSNGFNFLVTMTVHPFRKEPLTGSTKSQFVGTLHSSLRQKLQTTGCNQSCRVEGPKKLFLQKSSRNPQGPFTP